MSGEPLDVQTRILDELVRIRKAIPIFTGFLGGIAALLFFIFIILTTRQF